ncbi:MAG: hypothetical protein RL562_961 [Planctomycetota bacterium]
MVERRAMTRPIRPLLRCILAASTALILGGCSTHTHLVGLGPNGIAETSARQYWIFFGLLDLNEVDTQRLAGDLTSYRITTAWSFTDILLTPLLLPLTVTSRTVTVET